MSKKRGQTKMIDVLRAVKQTEEYEAAGQVAEKVVQDFVSVVVTKEPRARSRTFTAKPCAACAALREPDTNFTRVFATRGNIRYCRCHYCGNTWKDSDAVPHNGS